MPRKSKPSSKGRKRNYRRGARRQKTTLINKSLSPFASRYITKMKYSEAYNLTSISPNQTMNLNSVFDPNRTGSGHQPYGFDQLATLYNRYRVISCSYAINCYSGTTPVRFGCLPCNESPPNFSNMSELCENPRARWKVQIPNGSTQTLAGRVYIPALTGRTKAQYMADDRYQAAVNASPNELALLWITAQSVADAHVDTTITVTLEYTVEFFDPIPLDQS